MKDRHLAMVSLRKPFQYSLRIYRRLITDDWKRVKRARGEVPEVSIFFGGVDDQQHRSTVSITERHGVTLPIDHFMRRTSPPYPKSYIVGGLPPLHKAATERHYDQCQWDRQ